MAPGVGDDDKVNADAIPRPNADDKDKEDDNPRDGTIVKDPRRESPDPSPRQESN